MSAERINHWRLDPKDDTLLLSHKQEMPYLGIGGVEGGQLQLKRALNKGRHWGSGWLGQVLRGEAGIDQYEGNPHLTGWGVRIWE